MPVLSAFYWVMFAIIWVALAFWPAVVANNKGHSFIGYFILSLFFWPLSLLLAYLSADITRPDTHAHTHA
jgi:hypothetical protein